MSLAWVIFVAVIAYITGHVKGWNDGNEIGYTEGLKENFEERRRKAMNADQAQE